MCTPLLLPAPHLRMSHGLIVFVQTHSLCCSRRLVCLTACLLVTKASCVVVTVWFDAQLGEYCAGGSATPDSLTLN